MFLLQPQQVPESDLECMLGEPGQQREQDTGRKCGWQCAAAAFVLGLVMVTALSLKATSGTGLTNSSVTDAVQMESMEDPVWKQVLGHKAFEQFKKELNQKDQKKKDDQKAWSTRSTTRPASTTLVTETVAPRPTTTQPPTVPAVATKAPQTVASTVPPTAAPVAPLTPVVPSDAINVKMDDAPIVFKDNGKTAFDQIAAEFQNEASKLDPDSMEHKSLTSIGTMLSKMSKMGDDDHKSAEHKARPLPSRAPAVAPATTIAPAVAPAPPVVRSPLAPHEELKDGNTCPSDEEESEGTCFKKCSDLTGGYYPIRTSAFSCCAAEPCSFFNSKIHVGFCSGFDVSGDAEGDGCPSFEGACLLDEEMFGGLCYKKCSLFPDGQIYSNRVAPNICCSNHGFMCMLPKYFKFSSDFAVGGGKGDGNIQTPAEPHLPLKQLTEMEA